MKYEQIIGFLSSLNMSEDDLNLLLRLEQLRIYFVIFIIILKLTHQWN